MRPHLRHVVVVAVVLLVPIVPILVELYTDWLWFGETGYQKVFAKTLASDLASTTSS